MNETECCDAQSNGPVEVAPECDREGVNDRMEVRINRVENGFIVHVGCKTFVAHTWDEVSDGLYLFYEDPRAAYDKFVRKKK